jgi:hypothetical protein
VLRAHADLPPTGTTEQTVTVLLRGAAGTYAAAFSAHLDHIAHLVTCVAHAICGSIIGSHLGDVSASLGFVPAQALA